jgi:hypothetical protein
MRCKEGMHITEGCKPSKACAGQECAINQPKMIAHFLTSDDSVLMWRNLWLNMICSHLSLIVAARHIPPQKLIARWQMVSSAWLPTSAADMSEAHS